jgi:hypothetical protein
MFVRESVGGQKEADEGRNKMMRMLIAVAKSDREEDIDNGKCWPKTKNARVSSDKERRR